MTVTAASSIAGQVWARLQTLASRVTVFDGEIVDAEGNPSAPPVDEDGRAAAHAVFYPGPGHAESLMLDETPDTLTWTGQVTCVGGDRTRALWCADQVRGVLTGWRVTAHGGQLVPLMEPDGADPGVVRRDDTVQPSRFYVPLLFTTTI